MSKFVQLLRFLSHASAIAIVQVRPSVAYCGLTCVNWSTGLPNCAATFRHIPAVFLHSRSCSVETGVLKMEEDPKKISDEEWKKRLTSEEYEITRQKATEMPFTGKYYDFKGVGSYHCSCCGAHLFDSDTKYDSGSGWPSFYTANLQNIETEMDYTIGRKRTEVICKKCGAHQGHVFRDGPEPTGLRYCINSAAIKFKPKDQ